MYFNETFFFSAIDNALLLMTLISWKKISLISGTERSAVRQPFQFCVQNIYTHSHNENLSNIKILPKSFAHFHFTRNKNIEMGGVNRAGVKICKLSRKYF